MYETDQMYFESGWENTPRFLLLYSERSFHANKWTAYNTFLGVIVLIFKCHIPSVKKGLSALMHI